ncbi:MAG: hypothetical protein V9G12_14025 [Microthrixaceae bacterium]
MGSADEVTSQIRALADIGVTEFVAVEVGRRGAEADATRDVLRSLL